MLCDIRTHASLAAADKEKYTQYLMELSEHEWNGERASYQKEADGCQKRMSDLETILKKLYEDRVFGYYELQGLLDGFKKQNRDARKFAELVEAYTDITEVTEELLHTLVDKIVVHEKEVINGEIIMRVDIYYRFIGKVGDQDGEALKAPKIRRNTKLLMEAGAI